MSKQFTHRQSVSTCEEDPAWARGCRRKQCAHNLRYLVFNRIFKQLQYCNHSLNGNHIGDEGVANLSSALKNCTNLQTLR